MTCIVSYFCLGPFEMGVYEQGWDEPTFALEKFLGDNIF